MNTKKMFHLVRNIKDVGFTDCATCLGEKIVALGVECTDCKGTGKLSILQVFYRNELQNRQFNIGE